MNEVEEEEKKLKAKLDSERQKRPDFRLCLYCSDIGRSDQHYISYFG